MRARFLVAVAVPAAAFASLATTVNRSEGVTPADDVARAQCATRVSLALTGRAPSAELLAASDPQAEIDALLASTAFVEQFARFVNSQMNPEPGETPADDATYWLARHVLGENRPWRELFDGKYRVEAVPAADGMPATARVVDDPDGLGYFRSRPWMIRYAGNEEEGYRLNSAFRIQQNVIGLEVMAVTNAPDTDISATGRQAAACRSCHYDSYFALDKVAKVLSRVSGPMNNPTFTPPSEGPQALLDGRMIGSDAELVQALVESTQHKFHTCRLGFQYLYGRAEAQCESALFDRCIDEYTTTGDIRAALRVIAADQSFCE
jgi:hypothetical protein